MKKGDKDEPAEDDYSYLVKNLDTGETLDIEEASIKFSVMGLDRASAKDEDKSSGEFNIYQQISEEDEDSYFDAFLETLQLELEEQKPEPVQIPTGARLHFLRICGYEIVTDDESRKFCVFILEVHCNVALPTKWKVYRRYSEFRKLNHSLRSEGYYVPVMPPKTMFNSFTDEFISKRKDDLEQWLHNIAYQPSIDQSAKDPLTNETYRDFLIHGANNPPFRHDNGNYRMSEDVAALADGKISRFQTLDEKIRAAKQLPKVGIDDFELVRVIGKGSFGKVTLVRKKNDGKLYAMKVLSKPNIVRRKQVEHTKTERRVLGTINHPFIVKLHYAFQTQSKLYFVLDYAAGGELFFHLSRMKKFPEHITKFFCAEITSALDALHKIGVVYRDLKPENILLDSQGHIKLADFGLAKENVHEATLGATSLCGTPEYLSPEVLDRQGHGTAVDWWNLGMVTFEMLTGLPPWYTTDKQKLFDRLRNAPLKFPFYVSKPAASFIHSLLQRNPEDRLGSRGSLQVMNHRFFSDIDWGSLNRREIKPPFDPCRNHETDEDTGNFEKEFTNMPMYSVDEDPMTRGTIQSGDDMFSQFTYEGDSYLDRLSSRSMSKSPEYSRK